MPGTIDVGRMRTEYARMKVRMEAFETVAEAFEIDLGGNGHEEAGPTLVLLPPEVPATETVTPPKARKPKAQPAQRGAVSEAVRDVLQKAAAPMNVAQIQEALATRGLAAPPPSVKSALNRTAGVTRPGRGLYELKPAPSKAPDPATVAAYNQGFAAPEGTLCLYAEGSPHAIAWGEGHRDADKRRHGA